MNPSPVDPIQQRIMMIGAFTLAGIFIIGLVVLSAMGRGDYISELMAGFLGVIGAIGGGAVNHQTAVSASQITGANASSIVNAAREMATAGGDIATHVPPSAAG